MIALTKPGQFDATSEYTTWLCGIAKNICRNWWRKESGSREIFSSQDLEGIPTEYLEDPSLSILAKLEQEELQQTLLECVDKLPEAQREAMFWVFYEMASLEEAAKIMDCPPGTIKSRLYHARAKIADCVRLAFGIEGQK
jgi:RNA polymerase sigma-70 factor (ECF subfamily)